MFSFDRCRTHLPNGHAKDVGAGEAQGGDPVSLGEIDFLWLAEVLYGELVSGAAERGGRGQAENDKAASSSEFRLFQAPGLDAPDEQPDLIKHEAIHRVNLPGPACVVEAFGKARWHATTVKQNRLLQ